MAERYPWLDVDFLGWRIGAMNHYTVAGRTFLYVLMKKGDQCIVAQGCAETAEDCDNLWKVLGKQARML